MPLISVSQDTYDWFQHIRRIKLKDGRKITLQEDEAVILMLNMWEAGNMGKQAAESIQNPKKVFPQQVFKHYNGKFFRSL